MTTMNRKRYSTPTVCVFHVRAAHALLSGSPQCGEGVTVVPGEQHDPNDAGSRLEDERSTRWNDDYNDDYEE